MSLLIYTTGKKILNRPLPTGQTTVYHAGDDADAALGVGKPTANYLIMNSGAQTETTIVKCPHYAAATISFDAASKKMLDSASGLATIAAGDTVYIHNGLNGGASYVVATGGNAAEVVFTTAPVTESAGSYITVYKQAAWSNNCVLDLKTKNTWLRYSNGAPALRLGVSGLLNWFDAATCFTLHAAAADLQMIKSSHTLRIVGGAAEVGVYKVGMCLLVAGFSNAANNLAGRWIVSISVNGADLDIVLGSFGLLSGQAALNTLVDEVAGGSRTIKVECQSGFAVVADARVASLGGYSDWRIPTSEELEGIMQQEAGAIVPNAAAFPSFPAVEFYVSTTAAGTTANAKTVRFSTTVCATGAKTAGLAFTFVRG